MKSVQKIAAFLAKRHFLVYVFLGIAMMHLLKVLSFYPSMKLIKDSLWVVAPCWLTINWTCSTFYADKYKEYTQNLGPLIATIPHSDPYFYQTIIFDIGTPRKIAGYFYVIDKVITFCAIGAAFHLAIVVIANKH